MFLSGRKGFGAVSVGTALIISRVWIKCSKCHHKSDRQHPREAAVLAGGRSLNRFQRERGMLPVSERERGMLALCSPPFYSVWNHIGPCCSHLGVFFPPQPNLETPSGVIGEVCFHGGSQSPEVDNQG